MEVETGKRRPSNRAKWKGSKPKGKEGRKNGEREMSPKHSPGKTSASKDIQHLIFRNVLKFCDLRDLWKEGSLAACCQSAIRKQIYQKVQLEMGELRKQWDPAMVKLPKKMCVGGSSFCNL